MCVRVCECVYVYESMCMSMFVLTNPWENSTGMDSDMFTCDM